MLLFDLTPAHAEVLHALHAASFNEPWSISSFKNLLTLPTTVGWMNQCGFILCSYVADEMEILTVCTHPDKRRKGIGSALLSRVISFAQQRQIRHIFLEVAQNNTAAQALYQSHGFKQTGIRPHYYKTGDGFEDALCLTKTIAL